MDYEDEDEEQREARQRLIRTVPTVDWFDVEGNEVSGAQPLEDPEVSARSAPGSPCLFSPPGVLWLRVRRGVRRALFMPRAWNDVTRVAITDRCRF